MAKAHFPMLLAVKNILPILAGAIIAVSCHARILSDTMPVSDYSKASTDGPHVFYRNGRIIVKSVIIEDSIAIAQKAVANQKSELLLTCLIPESNDSFSFRLADSIYTCPTEYPVMPEKVLALSDIEGNFQAFKTMLIGAQIMDNSYNWAFGQGHLVLLGDYFDRGVNVTECLWLAYKLEVEARKAGGMVHFILGNHEIMNLSGDDRYVRNKYIENAELINEEYKDWYSNHTELGRWLRSKNAVEKIGDYIFCHGGISPQLAASRMSLEDINRIARRWYGTPEKWIKDVDAALIFNSTYGIFWYRDLAKNRADLADINYLLNRFQAKRIVIGHTLTEDIRALYNGKVICIDLQHEENMRRGFVKSLLIENKSVFGFDSHGTKSPVFSLPLPSQSSGNHK